MVARQLTAATHFPGQFPARQTGTGEQCSPLQEFFDSLRGCFTSPKKKDRSCKAFFGFTTSVFCFKLIVVNKKTQKQKQHIEILEKSQQLKFRMPTEIRISKHNALYQASIQLEGLDYTKLYRAYSGIRKSQIEPRVLFKVLVCAYMKGVYSSRKIEELCRENLVFRWLLEDQKTLDHCTIARFRGNRNLQEAFEDLFFQYVKKLENKGYTEYSEVFVDGTKIESKANRYTFVWLKQVSKQLEKIKARLKELVCSQGNLTSTKVEKRLEQLNTEIEAQGIEVKKGRGHHKPEIVRERDELALLYRRWMEYNRKKAICGENRNSYSKTDTDATFMHMKDDHMRNGQLKPGYNVQFAVNSGFITGIGVFSNRAAFGTLIPFLTYLWHKHGKSYRNVVADSGYESLANYRWLFENGRLHLLSPPTMNQGKNVLQSHRLAEWKTWAITNRMTALSARTADIWISVLTIPPMRRTVQNAISLFTAVRTAPTALTAQPAARLKTAKSAKKFLSAGNFGICARIRITTLPPRKESCCAATVLFRQRVPSDS